MLNRELDWLRFRARGASNVFATVRADQNKAAAKRRRERARYPVRWLTYKARLRDDVETAYRSAGGIEFFSDNYLASLTSAAKDIQGWELRIISLNFAISLFLLLGVVHSENSISLFGISLKSATGVKEILVAVSASLVLIAVCLAYFKDTRIYIIEKVVSLKTPAEFADLALWGAYSSYWARFYGPKQYQRWVFPTRSSRIVRFTLGSLFIAMAVSFFAASTWLQAYVLMDIYLHPTLPRPWSYVLIIYSVAGYLLFLFAVVVQHVPLSHRDNSVLLELQRLQKTDPQLHQAKLQQLFGED